MVAGTAEQARAELERALKRGLELPLAAQGMTAPSDTARASAVLILFGALDRVPAKPAAAARAAAGVADISDPANASAASAALEAAAPLHSASAMPVAPELDVLLTMRSNGLRNHAGQIAFPGGGAEPDDADRIATALREATEETGLDPDGVDVLGTLPEAHIPVSNYRVTPVLGWWRLPSEVAADHSESVEVFRVPVAELIDPAARGTALLRDRGRTYRGQAFQLGPQFGGHIVWGFTAMLLSGIFDSMGWSQPWDTERVFEVSRTAGAQS
jgi:8-oxo-dGTP pyrophosphatase MutT (NUDIX family)